MHQIGPFSPLDWVQFFKTLFLNRNFLPIRDLARDRTELLSIYAKHVSLLKVVVIGDQLTYLKVALLYLHTNANQALLGKASTPKTTKPYQAELHNDANQASLGRLIRQSFHINANQASSGRASTLERPSLIKLSLHINDNQASSGKASILTPTKFH